MGKDQYSNNENELQWYDLMEDTYNVALAEQNVSPVKQKASRWWRQLEARFGDITNAEVVSAIEDSTKKNRKASWGKPTIKDLKIWIAIQRKENRLFNDEPLREKCSCGDGWILYTPAGKSEYRGSYAVPCICALGERVRRMAYPDMNQEEAEDQREKARIGHKQKRERQAQLRKIYEDKLKQKEQEDEHKNN